MTRYIPLLIFSLFSFLCSCTSDIDQTGTEKQRVTLTLSLGCRDMVTADFLQPQADDTPAAVAEVRDNTTKGDNTTQNGTGTDLIRDAYVVMCKNGTVEHIYHVINEDGKDFERHQVASISTETGEYTFYSFANLLFTTNEEGGQVKSLEIHGVEVMPGTALLYVKFTVGEGLPNFRFNNKDYGKVDSMVVSCEYNGFDLVTSNKGRGIPMSNKETHTIDNNMTLVLSLYRLLAKMQMTFNNKTDQPIRILKITTGDITKNTGETLTRPSCTYLFPPLDGNGLVTTNFERITSHDTCSYVHYPKPDKPDECQEIAANGTHKFPDFYINDSEATNAVSFPLTILMQRQDAAGNWVKDERKALIQLPRIPRNTVAYVKINLTDYVLKLKAFTYAPIGGYPPFVVTQNDDFYVTFTRPGDFELRPSLYKYVDSANPEKWIDLNDKKQVADAHIDVADPNGILGVKPTLDPVTGEIIGSIAKAADGTAKPGTATIRLTINIVNAANVIQPYTRTIYVVSAPGA